MSNKEKIWTAMAAVFGVLVLVIGLVAVLNAGGDDEPKAAPETVKTTEPEPEPSEAPSISTMEEAFLEVVREQNIEGTDAELVSMGHEVCDLFDSGYTFDDFVDQALISLDSTEDAEQAFYFIGVSVGAFCPEHADKIRAGASSGV